MVHTSKINLFSYKKKSKNRWIILKVIGNESSYLCYRFTFYGVYIVFVAF